MADQSKKGMTTQELAKYYRAKRLEYLGATPEEIEKSCAEPNIKLGEEMDKLIEAVNK